MNTTETIVPPHIRRAHILSRLKKQEHIALQFAGSKLIRVVVASFVFLCLFPEMRLPGLQIIIDRLGLNAQFQPYNLIFGAIAVIAIIAFSHSCRKRGTQYTVIHHQLPLTRKFLLFSLTLVGSIAVAYLYNASVALRDAGTLFGIGSIAVSIFKIMAGPILCFIAIVIAPFLKETVLKVALAASFAVFFVLFATQLDDVAGSLASGGSGLDALQADHGRGKVLTSIWTEPSHAALTAVGVALLAISAVAFQLLPRSYLTFTALGYAFIFIINWSRSMLAYAAVFAVGIGVAAIAVRSRWTATLIISLTLVGVIAAGIVSTWGGSIYSRDVNVFLSLLEDGDDPITASLPVAGTRFAAPILYMSSPLLWPLGYPYLGHPAAYPNALAELAEYWEVDLARTYTLKVVPNGFIVHRDKEARPIAITHETITISKANLSDARWQQRRYFRRTGQRIFNYNVGRFDRDVHAQFARLTTPEARKSLVTSVARAHSNPRSLVAYILASLGYLGLVVVFLLGYLMLSVIITAYRERLLLPIATIMTLGVAVLLLATPGMSQVWFILGFLIYHLDHRTQQTDILRAAANGESGGT